MKKYNWREISARAFMFLIYYIVYKSEIPVLDIIGAIFCIVILAITAFDLMAQYGIMKHIENLYKSLKK